MGMYELPRTLPDARMPLAPEYLGSTILFLVRKWISKSFKANGAIVPCPLTVQ
jgi:hypothetical protein